MIYYLFIIKSVVNYICECSASYENPLRRNVYIPPNKDFIFLKKFENINVTTRILNFYEKNSMLDNVCTNSNYYYIFKMFFIIIGRIQIVKESFWIKKK
jgi:hypothetical protein